VSPLSPTLYSRAQTAAALRPSSFGAAEADRLDDAALDELPFGVMCLAPDGLILRYNAAEGRLARLDPSTVVGRNFFTDVAPCTYTEDFYGRWKSLVDRDQEGSFARFRYVFDFKFGAQQVDVEIHRVPGAARFYLFINRTQFMEERKGPEAREPAPMQAELAKDEAERGILRNDYAERIIAAPVSLLETLERTFERRAPQLWRDIGHEWGLNAGRRLVIELETMGVEDDDRALRQRPMKEVAEVVSRLLREQGWGRLSFDLGDSSHGVLRLELESSALVGRTRKQGRSCHVLAGILEAVLTHVAQRRLHVEEVSCASTSRAACCEMMVVGEGRRETVVELAAAGSSFDEILAALEVPHGEA
jgi:photoactive yellow protein